MSGRLRASADEHAEAQGNASVPIAQLLHAPIQAYSTSDPQDPSIEHPSLGDFGRPSASHDPAPSSEQLYDNSTRAETSAQGAARYSSENQSISPLVERISAEFQPAELPPRAIDHTSDTFGRTSGKSTLSESRASTTGRRKASPTEKSAFGYLGSGWNQQSGSGRADEITEYLSQGSARSQHQRRIVDALERELNLSESSSPVAAASSPDDDDMWTTGATGGSHQSAIAARQRSHPTSLGVSRSDTPDRTFGRPSNEQSQHTTHSGGRLLPLDDSLPSNSGTTSSRETNRSRNVAYGVGEAGGDQQFSALTRTLSPDQRRHQEELDRMSQQRSVATPASTYTALTPQITSPVTESANQRASHQSNATVTASAATATSGSVASFSTPRHDARYSRQTQASMSSSAAPPLSYSEQQGYERAYTHQALFEGGSGSSGSPDSVDMLSGRISPQLAEGPTPARSASVRVKTPMFGNTLSELPPNQRASFKGALHEKVGAPFEMQDSVHGGLANLNSEQEVESVQPALYDPHQEQVAPPIHAADATESYAYRPQSQPAAQHYEATRGYYMTSVQLERQAEHADHALTCPAPAISNVVQVESHSRLPFVPHLGDMYAVAPKFPAPPYSKHRVLHLSSPLARIHHTCLPLITYCHIPITLFLDFNVIFALTQIALHPDDAQDGWRTAWWIATAIYAGSVFVWLVGVVVIYETLWSYRRRWMVPQPLVMPIYLSSPAFVLTAIKDYSLYSLLYRARASGTRRDALIESFWYYSQNWPTVITLVPRGVISAIVLVLYKPTGPALVTAGPRDPFYFNQATERLSQYAFIVITIQAAWVAWKLGLLLVANVGLMATLGCKSLVQKERDRNAVADLEMTSFAGHSRRGLITRQIRSQPAPGQVWRHDQDAAQYAADRRWAWRWRAEDRIRAILFDAGLLHQPVPMQDWQHDHEGDFAPAGENAGDHTVDSTRAQPTTYAQAPGADGYDQHEQPRDWFGTDLQLSQSQTGLALTSPEAVQPEIWANTQARTTDAEEVRPAPAIEQAQALHLQHFDSSPSHEGDSSNASDPYSPAPLPIGRSPRSKEQLRDASISSRNDRNSMREPSSSSLNRLVTLHVPPSAVRDSAQAAESATTPASLHQSHDDTYTVPKRAADVDVFDSGSEGYDLRPREKPGSSSRVHAVGSQESNAAPAPVAALGGQSSNDTGLLGERRGRKRPRSSPVPAYVPGLDPSAMVAETEDWLRGQIDEEDGDGTAQPEQQDPAVPTDKLQSFDNDRQVMHTFVPVPSSFAMSHDPSMAGSPDQGGSDLKHSSWTAAAPNPELFASKVASTISTLPMPQQAGPQNASTTSLGSSSKAGRSGANSRPRTPGHGHEASSEDGISLEGADAGRKRNRNSFLGRLTSSTPSESSRRRGSGGKVEGEAWIASLFGGGRPGSRKVSNSDTESCSPKVTGIAGDSPGPRLSESTPRTEPEDRAELEAVPTVITTSASTSFPTVEGGSVEHYDAAHGTEAAIQDVAPGSLLLAPIGAGQPDGGRSKSPSGSYDSNASLGTDDSEEGRLWASFPNQSRRHPPGLIALDIEQQSLAERRLAAAIGQNNAALQQHRLVYGAGGSSSAPSLPGSALNLSPLLHPNVLAAFPGGSPLGMPGLLGGMAQLSVSPSEGGLHAIREESWSSSLDSRSQGATGSTRSRGTASAVTASPVDADFPLEQIEEIAMPHHSSSTFLRRRDSS